MGTLFTNSPVTPKIFFAVIGSPFRAMNGNISGSSQIDLVLEISRILFLAGKFTRPSGKIDTHSYIRAIFVFPR